MKCINLASDDYDLLSNIEQSILNNNAEKLNAWIRELESGDVSILLDINLTGLQLPGQVSGAIIKACLNLPNIGILRASGNTFEDVVGLASQAVQCSSLTECYLLDGEDVILEKQEQVLNIFLQHNEDISNKPTLMKYLDDTILNSALNHLVCDYLVMGDSEIIFLD